MLKYTRHSLKKLEALMNELEYTVRYEKGNFNSGYCIVENKKIAVINKFFDVEGRMNCLLDILQNLEVEEEKLSEASVKLLKKIEQSTAQDEEEE
ncbi:hypothetical protein CRP01_27335 [Flavilitoribacter nigricans DSM 23189 = NBRC 102662]|uniref:Uncharacterized protein n=2 Tax=Flavilitoribacter TaxID=2762562 RepID=A0A2D0N4T8_FLAN2|nr:hypothetical protein CRP01_27335 [Flavilitoribacter nigricans DSM 23189 = NBRC 102662]